MALGFALEGFGFGMVKGDGNPWNAIFVGGLLLLVKAAISFYTKASLPKQVKLLVALLGGAAALLAVYYIGTLLGGSDVTAALGQWLAWLSAALPLTGALVLWIEGSAERRREDTARRAARNAARETRRARPG